MYPSSATRSKADKLKSGNWSYACIEYGQSSHLYLSHIVEWNVMSYHDKGKVKVLPVLN